MHFQQVPKCCCGFCCSSSSSSETALAEPVGQGPTLPLAFPPSQGFACEHGSAGMSLLGLAHGERPPLSSNSHRGTSCTNALGNSFLPRP